MNFFQPIEGEAAVLVTKGVYKQVPLYRRGGHLYAKHGAGFVRLMADGATTAPSVRLETISVSELYRDPLGRLCLGDVDRATPLPVASAAKLLGAGE